MTKSQKIGGWNIMLKGRTVFVSMTTPGIPHITLCLAVQTVGQRVAFLECQPPGQVLIGSPSLMWGRDRVDTRICFAYWVMKDGQRVGGDGWRWWMITWIDETRRIFNNKIEQSFLTKLHLLLLIMCHWLHHLLIWLPWVFHYTPSSTHTRS